MTYFEFQFQRSQEHTAAVTASSKPSSWVPPSLKHLFKLLCRRPHTRPHGLLGGSKPGDKTAAKQKALQSGSIAPDSPLCCHLLEQKDGAQKLSSSHSTKKSRKKKMNKDSIAKAAIHEKVKTKRRGRHLSCFNRRLPGQLVMFQWTELISYLGRLQPPLVEFHVRRALKKADVLAFLEGYLWLLNFMVWGRKLCSHKALFEGNHWHVHDVADFLAKQSPKILKEIETSLGKRLLAHWVCFFNSSLLIRALVLETSEYIVQYFSRTFAQSGFLITTTKLQIY